MSFRINTQAVRTYTRAALAMSAITSAIQGCIVLFAAFAGASFIKRTLDLSPTFVHAAAAAVFIAFVISAARDLYLSSRISSELSKLGPSLDVAGSAATSPRPANPNAILEFEQRMVDMERPFAWARAIGGVILGVTFVALTVFALRHFGPPDSSNLVVYLFGLMFVLVVLGSTVSDVYTTWARYSIPLSEKRNVVVKPVELLLLVIWLSCFAAFASLFASSG
ncbi:MAG TPA: hypothetical protein VGO46_08595, partial [Gemmatimonadaceae bacterium]|nr:hypothetical protein [Gemmatimonadaceae bacterium]